MNEFPIKTFKYGLDTRKEQLTSAVGTLVALQNAYINEGGEIAKRGKFERLDSYEGYFMGVFVDSTMYVFSSDMLYGSVSTQGQPVASLAPATNFISSVIHQQLKHPTLTNDSAETYDASKHLMTKLIAADAYNGKTLAVAEFADGNQFLYYDGELVQQSANGLVLAGRLAVSDLATDIARQFEPIGWDVDLNVDENGTAQNGSSIVKSPVSDYFGGILSVDSSGGVFGIRQFDNVSSPTAGVKASAKFSITVNTGTFEVLAPAQAETTTPTVSLTGTAIAANGGGAASTATDIATAINDFSSDHGYTAVADGINVEVFAPLGYDIDVAIDLTVNVTTGTVTSGTTTTTALTATITTPVPIGTNASGRVSFADGVLTVERFVNVPTGTHLVRADLRMTVAGGSPTYTYQWNETTSGSANGMTPNSSTTQSLRPELMMEPNSAISGSFKCVVTDSTGGSPLTATRFITVQLICTYVQGA